MDRIEIKTKEDQPRIAGALVRTVIDHLRSNYGDFQHDRQIGYMSVVKEGHFSYCKGV